ncbi:trimethylamine corrinoid protein 2 [Candidatus Epulonipiscioides gigas]|nr:trimethylamine corrinoid protein 2 [Epulopiscium sp. SCG-C07WGA-EpuloA2]
MKYKEDIDIVRKRLDAFWEREIIDRALIAVKAPKTNKTPNKIIQSSDLRKYWLDPDEIYKRNLDTIQNTFYGGDALPAIFLNFGTSGHCNYFGAKPRFENKNTIWFDPIWDDLSECEGSYETSVLDEHIAITKELLKRANGEFFIGLPDSCGTVDALGHLYGSENVLMDMMSDPEAVKRAIEVVNEGWMKSNQAFYDAFKEANQDIVHSWMHLIAPSKMGQMQCDMSVMFSKEMYEDFVKDELQTQIDWFDYPVYHFDGIEQERHLDILLSFDKLKAIQWTNVAGQPPATHFMPILQRIQAAGKGLIVFVKEEEIPFALDNLSAKGLLLLSRTNDEESAKNLVKYVEKHSKE